MGCFGDMEPTKQTSSSQTSGPPGWVTKAGKENYQLAKSVMDQGFVPYTGEFVAPLSGNQQQASSLISGAASNPNPNAGAAASDFTAYGAAPGFNYDFSSVIDPNGPLGPISGYMDPYLAAVLDPTLNQIARSGAQARLGINANATQSGAFGDARHGVVEGEQRRDELQNVSDVTGKAYSDAFNTALGQRQQDLSRNFATQQAQQGADEARLARLRQSGIDLSGLDTSTVGNAINLAQALGQTGGVEQATQQASDTANYNEFLRQQGFTDNQIAFLTSVLSGTPKDTITSSTATQSQPNNSGYQALGSLASIAGSLLL